MLFCVWVKVVEVGLDMKGFFIFVGDIIRLRLGGRVYC